MHQIRDRAERLKEQCNLSVNIGGTYMKYPIRHRLILACALLLAGFAAGCATTITPLPTSDPIPTDGSHGLLIGNIRLAWHGTDKSKGLTQPLDMKWSLEEETQGKRFLLADLPTAGPFVVKLPAGSYRIISIRFHGLWEIWHTMLPTTFQVQPGGCTSLGTWELRRETELLEDWITGQIFKNLEPAQAELQHVLAAGACSTVVASSESFVRSKLVSHNSLVDFEF
jgi:hypothetical protein